MNSRTPWPVTVALLVYATILAIVGYTCFPFGLTTETDAYHIVVRELMHGRVVLDGFHPLLFPIVSTIPAYLSGSALFGCRLVSIVSACLLILATMRMASSAASPRAGFFALVLVLPNATLAMFAPQALSDIMAAALSSWALVFLLRSTTSRSLRTYGGAAAMAGLATATRMPSLLVWLLVVLVGLFHSGALRTRLLRIGLAVAGLGLGFLPQSIATFAGNTSFVDAGVLRLLVFKYVCHWDSYELQGIAEGQELGLLWGRFADIVREAATDFCAAWTDAVPNLMTGHAWSPWFAGSFLLGLFVLASVAIARHRVSGLLALFVVGHVVLIAVTFRSDTRVLLPILAPAVALVAVAMQNWSRWIPALMGLGLLGLVPAAAMRLKRMDGMPEVLAARVAVAELHPTILASTWLLMQHEVSVPCVFLPPAGNVTPELAWERVRSFTAQYACDLAVIGRASAPPMYEALGRGEVPAFAKIVKRTDDVVVVRIDRMPAMPGDLVFDNGAELGAVASITFAPKGPGPAAILRLAALVRADGGESTMLELASRGGAWAVQLPKPLPAGRYAVSIFATTENGVLDGPTLEVRVP